MLSSAASRYTEFMARAGRLIEVGLDGVGYIDCPDSDLLYSFRVADIGSGLAGLALEELNGKSVRFELDGNKAINIVFEPAALTMVAAT
jgi:hypothetical protein